MVSSVRLATIPFPLLFEPPGVGGGVGKPFLAVEFFSWFEIDAVLLPADMVVLSGCPFLRINLLLFVFFGESMFVVFALTWKAFSVCFWYSQQHTTT